MTDTTLTKNSSSSVSLKNSDTLTVNSGVSLSGSSKPMVSWKGGSGGNAIIDNKGTIASTGGNAIETDSASSGNLTIDNEVGATITSSKKDGIHIDLSSGSSTVTVNNAGTISTTGTGSNNGQAFDFNGFTSSSAHAVINNAATGVISAADADAIRPGVNMTINNHGLIKTTSAPSNDDGNDAIDFQSGNTGGVVNNFSDGTIDGSRHGITGDQNITVTNSGTIIGEAGSGINLDTTSGTTTITNNAGGVITGTALSGDDGDGIDVDYLVSIDNFGTIQAVGLTSASNGSNEAIAVGGGTIHNEVGGLIVSDQGAITVDNSNNGNAYAATTIINEGTIWGKTGSAINIVDTYADTVTNKGTITGSVSTSGGNDIFNAYAGSSVSGTIDLGSGTDTINLLGAGAGTLGTVANAENLNVEAGTWTVASAGSFDTIDIAAGAVLTSGIAVTKSIAVTVGGSLIPASGRAIDAKSGLANGSTFTINVEAGGQIIANDDAIRINKDFSNGTVTIDNAGLIQATGGQAIDLTEVVSQSTLITITNEVTGILKGVDADAVRGGGNSIIDNYGQIVSVATGDDVNDGIDFQDDGDGTVHNYGGASITGAHHGVTGSQGITVINDAGGTITGQSGSAVNIDNDSSVASTVTVANYGTMLGQADANQSDSDGDAVDVDGLLQLDNYGLIAGQGAHGYHDGTSAEDANISEGVAAGGGIIHNEAGATIYGYGRAIQIDDSANGGAFASTTIINEGVIEGGGNGPEGVSDTDAAIMQAKIDNREAIDILGSFADIITNKGQIIGGVFTDGGDDVFNAYIGSSVSGLVDLGDGNDTVNLYATEGDDEIGTVGQFANVETLNVVSGDWIVYGDNSADISVGNGGVLNLGYGSTATGAIVIGNGGNVYDYGTASDVTVHSGGAFHVSYSGSASNIVVEAGGYQDVFWGTVIDVSLSGNQQVVAGGTAIDTTIEAGGAQYVGADGLTDGTVINAGGSQYVDAGATAIDTVVAGGDQVVIGSATGTIVQSGSAQHVYSGGSADQTTVAAGGFQNVIDATVTNTLLGGNQQVLAGGSAIGTEIAAGGGAYIGAGGSANGSVIDTGGMQYVDVGGVAAGTDVEGGYFFVGGTANDTSLVSGTEVVAAGGVQNGIDFGGGAAGVLYLADASGLTGTISNFEAGDVIDLLNTSVLSSAFDGTTLTLATSEGTYAWQFADVEADTAFNVIGDGNGGTMISLALLSQYSASFGADGAGSESTLVPQDTTSPATVLTTPHQAAA